MKVVLLAGGLGTRMREETQFRPKPMVEIGGQPALWHIMKIYASFGHTDFIVCAGFKGKQILDFFQKPGSRESDLLNPGEISPSATSFSVGEGGVAGEDWNVTVVDTGDNTPTGGRLHTIRHLLEGEQFLCSYGDGIAPVNLARLLSTHQKYQRVATVSIAKPSSRFGVVETGPNKLVRGFREKGFLSDYVSIGFFVFNPDLFNYLDDDSILEDKPLKQLVAEGELSFYEHEGFWQPMDTHQELLSLNKLWDEGNPPWKIWT